ncbi:MAG: PLDc N-terminal domain-containing protein [archaeon]
MGLFGGGLIGLIALICAVWVIYDVVTKNKKLTDGMKILWIVLAIVLSIITAIIYYFVYKSK